MPTSRHPDRARKAQTLRRGFQQQRPVRMTFDKTTSPCHLKTLLGHVRSGGFQGELGERTKLASWAERGVPKDGSPLVLTPGAKTCPIPWAADTLCHCAEFELLDAPTV